MPPRVVKRGGAAGSRRGRGRGKAQNPQPEVHEGVAKAEDVSDAVVEVRDVDDPVEEIKVEDKPVVVDKVEVVAEQAEVKLDGHGADTIEDKGDEAKESVDEYGRDERLELDDNEPEFEGEEYVGVDYDEKEMETEEAGDEIEEEPEEEHDIEEKRVDGSDDEEVPEVEGDDDDEQAPAEEIEHADAADAAEHEERQKIVQERRKRKEFEVFVGGLDKDASESDVRKVFSQVGEVVEVRLMMNTQTKKNKGFAFLRFSTVEQAKRAVTELKNPVINGKKCGVTPSQDSDTLFLGNICKTWTKEALKERLRHYGVDNIDDITLVEDTNKEGMNRGFAFLEFSSRSDAMDAFKRLQRKDVLFGVERPAKVSFADSFIDPGDEIMAQVKTIFIDCLPPSWDEDRVRELLKKYGQIEKIELARNMPSAGRKDYGFVTFDSHDAAVTCAKSINNTELGEGENKAKVRARLSRPHQKGRSKHGGRDNFRSGRASGRSARSSFGRPAAHGLPRPVRPVSSRVPPVSMKRHALSRGRRPVASVPSRARPLPLPPRSYDRRAPGAVPPYPRSSLKREYSRRDDLPPRSRAAIDYSSRIVPDRRPPYRDDYVSRGSAYSDYSRAASRGDLRRPFVEDGYSSRFERPSPSYRDGRGRDYDAIGSKRPFSALEDVPPRYVDPGVRHSRARIDYEPIPAAPHYGDAYSDRFARSSMGYGGSRSSVSNHDTHGLYSGRQPMSYSGGSYSSTDAAGAYSSSGYSSDYIPRGSDVSGSSYSSLYPGRGAGGSSYMGSGSGSYY